MDDKDRLCKNKEVIMRIIATVFFLLHSYACSLQDREQKEYYDDGTLKCVHSYKSKALHGTYRCYYENGTLKEEGAYSMGKKNGLFKVYYQTGVLQSVRSFQNDTEEGPYEYYYASGNLSKKGMIRNGIKYGFQYEYADKKDSPPIVCPYFINYLGNETMESLTKFDSLGNMTAYYSEVDFAIDEDREGFSIYLRLQAPDFKETDFVVYYGCYDADFSVSESECIDTLHSDRQVVTLSFKPGEVPSLIRGVVELKEIVSTQSRNDTLYWVENIRHIPFEKQIERSQ